jgi:hypothetical protein
MVSYHSVQYKFAPIFLETNKPTSAANRLVTIISWYHPFKRIRLQRTLACCRTPTVGVWTQLPFVCSLHGKHRTAVQRTCFVYGPRTNLFDDENRVFNQLPLKHWVNDPKEQLQVSFAVPEWYDDCQPLARHAVARGPLAAGVDAIVR